MKRWLSILVLAYFFIFPSVALADVCCVCAPTNKPEDKTCITGTASTCEEMLSASKNQDLKKVKCDEAKLSSIECKSKKETGGLCPIGPISATSYTTAISSDTGVTELAKPIVPDLFFKIPGLVFASKLEEKGGKISIPFLSQYISASYRALTGISAIAAAIMIVYGGFLYIIASTGIQTRAGKDIIKNAVAGLIIVMGAYVILETVDKNLLHLETLDVPVVKREIVTIPDSTFQRSQALAKASGFVPDKTISDALKANSGGTAPATRMFPDNPFDPRTTIPAEQLDNILSVVATSAGVEPCILKAIVNTESGRKQNAVGHDEDALDVSIQARLNFMRTGTKFSKTAFTLPIALPNNCTKAVRDQCVQSVKGASGIKNDDELTAAPPEFGLDWRYSHGFGVGQCTIFPPKSKNSCVGADGAYGVNLGNKCFTVPILLTWEGQLECMATIIKSSAGKTPCEIFGAYSGAGEVDPTCSDYLLKKKMDAYSKCKAS